jgi:hypothetical protein
MKFLTDAMQARWENVQHTRKQQLATTDLTGEQQQDAWCGDNWLSNFEVHKAQAVGRKHAGNNRVNLQVHSIFQAAALRKVRLKYTAWLIRARSSSLMAQHKQHSVCSTCTHARLQDTASITQTTIHARDTHDRPDPASQQPPAPGVATNSWGSSSTGGHYAVHNTYTPLIPPTWLLRCLLYRDSQASDITITLGPKPGDPGSGGTLLLSTSLPVSLSLAIHLGVEGNLADWQLQEMQQQLISAITSNALIMGEKLKGRSPAAQATATAVVQAGAAAAAAATAAVAATGMSPGTAKTKAEAAADLYKLQPGYGDVCTSAGRPLKQIHKGAACRKHCARPASHCAAMQHRAIHDARAVWLCSREAAATLRAYSAGL